MLCCGVEWSAGPHVVAVAFQMAAIFSMLENWIVTGMACVLVDRSMRNKSQIAVGTCQVLPSMQFLVRSSAGGVLV